MASNKTYIYDEISINGRKGLQEIMKEFWDDFKLQDEGRLSFNIIQNSNFTGHFNGQSSIIQTVG